MPGEDEHYRSAHTCRRIHLLGYAKERTDPQKLAEYNVIHKG